MINLSLEIEEVEALLKHIGNGVYAEVAPLIAKIHGQAMPQVIESQKPVEVEPTSDATVV